MIACSRQPPLAADLKQGIGAWRSSKKVTPWNMHPPCLMSCSIAFRRRERLSMRFACHGPRLWLVYDVSEERNQSAPTPPFFLVCVHVPTQPGPRRKSNYLVPPCFGCQLRPDPVFLSSSRGLGRRYAVDRLPHRRLHPALHSRFLRSSIGEWVMMITTITFFFRFVNYRTSGIFSQ